MINLNELKEAIREMGSDTDDKRRRRNPLFRVLKEELMKLGHWKNRPRGDVMKGYMHGLGKGSE